MVLDVEKVLDNVETVNVSELDVPGAINIVAVIAVVPVWRSD